MCDIIYIYPATSGLAGPRQLLVFLSSPRLLPCFLSPSCSPPPKRGAADMAGLPRVPVYLKKKNNAEQNKTTARPQPQTQNPNPPRSLEAAPSSSPSLSAISCRGPWAPLLPSHLCLSPFFLLSSPAPRWDGDLLSYPRFTEKVDGGGGPHTTSMELPST